MTTSPTTPESHAPRSVVFFGTASFAVPSLEALVAHGWRVDCVVTQPDRPAGRGRHSTPSPVKDAAMARGLPVLQPERASDPAFVASVAQRQPAYLAVAAYGQILRQPLLDAACIAPVNVHGSLLPLYRGAAPIQRALMAGEQETGVTTMWMDAGMDTGDILMQSRVQVRTDDDSGSLAARLAHEGARLLVATLTGLATSSITRTPQIEAEATYAPKLQRQDTLIDWSRPAEEVSNLVRALSPRPGATARAGGGDLKVWRAEATTDPAGAASPGTVLSVEDSAVAVACGSGIVRLLQVQREGSRRMAAPEWARGAHIRAGDTFSAL